MRNSKLDLATGHLNTPVGPLVKPEHLALALREGSVNHVQAGSRTKKVRGLLLTLFVETTPALIAGCAREAGAGLQSVNRLYKETLADHLPRVMEWERFMAERMNQQDADIGR